jgi:hypothetical protein
MPVPAAARKGCAVDPETLARFRAWVAATFPPRLDPQPLSIPLGPGRGPVSMTPPYRPAATPTAAGVTAGFEFLVTAARRKRRRALLAAIEREADEREGARG